MMRTAIQSRFRSARTNSLRCSDSVKTPADDMIFPRFAGGFDDALCVGDDRSQSTVFPERLEDLAEDNPVRVIDVFVDELDLGGLSFDGVEPEATGRPADHPTTLLKIYTYGYLSRWKRR
jgi:hypothetical protein